MKLVKGIVILIVVILLSTAAFKVYLKFKKERMRGCGTQCQSNLKNFGTALAMYFTDNGELYPPSLAHLMPEYIEAIPTCFEAEKDTYSSSYMVSEDFKHYTVFCRGTYHKAVGITGPNWPQYTSENGLQARP